MAQGLTIGRECHGGDFFSAPVIAPQSQHYTFQPLIEPLLFNDWRWRRFEAFSARKPLQIRDHNNHSSHQAHGQHRGPTTHFNASAWRMVSRKSSDLKVNYETPLQSPSPCRVVSRFGSATTAPLNPSLCW